MAQFGTAGIGARANAADIDAGLRAHMNKVYGTMSVGLLITAIAAWAIAGLAVTNDPANATAMVREGCCVSCHVITLSICCWVVVYSSFLLMFMLRNV